MKPALLICAIFLLGGVVKSATMEVGSEEEIVERYVTAAHDQEAALRGVSMEVDIDANVPKLNKQGKLHALRNISKLGKVTYRMLGFDGDGAIKKEVIARYLNAEIEAQAGPNISITPQNYKFKYKGIQDHGGRRVYVLAVSPRKKEIGLFKGELWLDRDTCMPVRESGRFVKSPSIFLKRMEFVREYEIHDGVSIPQRISSVVKTRLFGPVELSVQFTNVTKESASDGVALVSSAEGQD